MKIFRFVTFISMILTLTVALMSVVGISITGFYPAIIVLFFISLIPIASRLYAKKITNKSNDFQRNYFTTLIIINLISILVVLWITFVVLVDRVFSKIL